MTDPIRQQLANALRKADCTCVEIDSQLHTEYRKCSRCRALAAHDAAQSAGREQEAAPLCWVRLLNGKVDWSEDCFGEKDYVIECYEADEGYSQAPVYVFHPPPSTPASVPVSDAVRALPAKWRKECPLTHHHFTRELEAALSADKASGEVGR